MYLSQMYSVQEQEFQLCFLVKNFPVGHKVLVDSADALDTGWGWLLHVPVSSSPSIVSLGDRSTV